MNAPALTTASANTCPAPANARPAGGSPGQRAAGNDLGDDDASTPIDASLAAPPPSLLGAWQAALLAREAAPGPVAAGAAAAAEPSATQQAVAATTLAEGHELRGAGITPTGADVAPLRFEADFKIGSEPAWQIGLQRGPDAAAWSLNLAASSVPAAWATTQLPRLERRLRLQGHEVDARWDAQPAQPQKPQPQPPEPRDGH
jgi:hypothetical protein